MSNARKLQTEIDRVMKKVDEGVELFDDIWEKVYNAEQQNQKEKYEMDLKKEIKKLQRLRDQIKTWIGSSEVKDKEPLLEARKLIETKMEQFKICEKETKTKTYSKEGLAREERLDPGEQAKMDTTTWIGDIVERLNNLVDEAELEIERLSSGKGKKTNKHLIDDHVHYNSQHRFHISKLEGIMRLVNNDVLDTEAVDALKDDLDYYMESYEDEDFQQGYDEDFFYEALGLDDLDVVNVDRVTQAKPEPKKKEDDDNKSSSTRGSGGDRKSKKSVSTVIPLTIGRARASSGGRSKKRDDDDGDKTPKKREPTPTTIPAATVPAARPAPPAPAGTSMAAILKRETEQQERERSKAAAAAQLQQQQQLQRQQQEAQLRQQEALRQQQQRQEASAKQKALQQQQQQQAQQQEALRQQQVQQEALQRQQQQQQQQAQQAAQQPQPGQTEAANARPQTQANVATASGSGATSLDALAGFGGLSLDGSAPAGVPAGAADSSSYLSALNESFATMPGAADNERNRQYAPRNPYPTPNTYPSTPSPIFDNPQVFEKLGTDALFFIFYYAQGTYQQYLAARELKKQSWRFHKKYMTWFQRHEEPKVTTDEYEQGTYVYFDYETGWCTRIKQDFRFEYSFLEDSLQ
eukprot:Nitzschia sp. Nitz4//scaffold323_size20210//2796//4926//NITZ4_008691-RA/size20210-snap-gene-0.0-mRNA-1//1//CDS//3329547864//4177//frame0